MLCHTFRYTTFVVFFSKAKRYASAEVVHGIVGRHLLDILAYEQHGKASVLHRRFKPCRGLACATIDNGSKVIGYDNAVLAVGSCMLTANEMFSYGHINR